MKNVYIYLFDGFSDWEIAYLTPEINKSDSWHIVYFSKDGNPVHSMGGMKVVADMALSQLNIEEVDMLILPGGTMWEQFADNQIVSLITHLNEANKPIAAICGATSELARLGMLDHVEHTSNALEYLKWAVPTYKGDAHYVNLPATTGRNIITACGVFPVDFAREVFRSLNLKSETELEKWYQLYKNGVWSE